MRWRWIDMEVEALDLNSKWSEMFGIKSWYGPRVSKYVK
jgi:hypothetical protein